MISQKVYNKKNPLIIDMSKNKVKPNKFYIEQNVDKTKNEHWGDENHDGTDLLNFPVPSRILICGSPDSGKTLLCKNILIHINPIPDNIFLLHQECFRSDLSPAAENDIKSIVNKDLESIKEYSGVKALYLKCIPPTAFWKEFSGKKNILIIDDIDLKSYCNSAARFDRINKLFSYVSTHRKLSIICLFQDVYSQGLPAIYRFSNIFCLFPMRDRNVQALIARNTGTDKDVMYALMELLKNSHDNITIDCANDSPAKYRYNLTKKIDIADD